MDAGRIRKLGLSASLSTLSSQKAALPTLLPLRNAGRVVSRDRILERVWKDRVVVDESVSRAISRIRTVLGDTKKPYRYIETLPKTRLPTGMVLPIGNDVTRISSVAQAQA